MLAYLAALVATAPAGLVRRLPGVPQGVAFEGTLWHGEAARDGLAAHWDFDPAGSVAALALRYEVRLTGPETALAGAALLWPGGATIERLTGRAGWGLVAAALPDATIACDPIATVTLGRIDLVPRPGTEGQIATPPGTCRDLSGGHPDPVPVPPLTAVATREQGTTRMVVTTPGTAAPLATASLDGQGHLIAELSAAGAALVPGLPGALGIELDITAPPNR